RSLQERRSSRDRTEDVKEGSVGGNLQVEVEQAVDENPATSEDAGQSDGAADVRRPVGDLGERLSIDCDYEPDHCAEPEQAHLGQQLQIVVARLVDKKVGVEAAKLRVD